MSNNEQPEIVKRRLVISVIIPLVFIILFWLIKFIEISLDINLAPYGMRPRDISQWFGIFTMPFLHGGFDHLLANTSSFLILGTILFYFYSKNSFQVLGLSWLLTGVLTWLIGRENSVHIGASGIIYAFAGFIFFSGVLSRNIRLMAISLIVVFMYGSMIWGLFPQPANVSWEGHLAGFISGIVLALIYQPPKPPVDETKDCYNCTHSDDEIEIVYTYKEEK